PIVLQKTGQRAIQPGRSLITWDAPDRNGRKAGGGRLTRSAQDPRTGTPGRFRPGVRFRAIVLLVHPPRPRPTICIGEAVVPNLVTWLRTFARSEDGPTLDRWAPAPACPPRSVEM